MPAPSSMFSRQSLSSDSSYQNIQQNQNPINEYQEDNEYNRNNFQMVESSPVNPSSMETRYDEVFESKPIREIKTMLWEIKEFNRVCEDKVERSMSFEFEMGRLGSMERHLPRRSRWKIMLDMENIGSERTPALRVLQLSPENKIIFYQLEACILEANGSGSHNSHQHKETDIQTPNFGYKEGLNDTKSFENLLPFQCNSLSGGVSLLDYIQNYTSEGSLLIKIKIEILEDVSM